MERLGQHFRLRQGFAGARTLELNLEPSAGTPMFDEARHGPAGELVPAWVEEMLAGR